MMGACGRSDAHEPHTYIARMHRGDPGKRQSCEGSSGISEQAFQEVPAAPDWKQIRNRIRQLEQRIQFAHPRAARDPQLASIISALRDEIPDQLT
jgi:hypothetical protein